jgi:hypothetical protein
MRNAAYNRSPAVFPVEDLRGVRGWAEVAPGGWKVWVDAADNGDEYLTVELPFSDAPSITIDN